MDNITSIDTVIGFKNKSSISLLMFTCLTFNSLSFNSINYFFNPKRLFFTFKSCFFYLSERYGDLSAEGKKKKRLEIALCRYQNLSEKEKKASGSS